MLVKDWFTEHYTDTDYVFIVNKKGCPIILIGILDLHVIDVGKLAYEDGTPINLNNMSYWLMTVDEED